LKIIIRMGTHVHFLGFLGSASFHDMTTILLVGQKFSPFGIIIMSLEPFASGKLQNIPHGRV